MIAAKGPIDRLVAAKDWHEGYDRLHARWGASEGPLLRIERGPIFGWTVVIDFVDLRCSEASVYLRFGSGDFGTGARVPPGTNMKIGAAAIEREADRLEKLARGT